MHLVLKWVNTQFPQVAFDTLLEGGCNWKFGKRGIVTLKNAPSFSFRLSPFTATNVMKRRALFSQLEAPFGKSYICKPGFKPW